MTPEEKHVGVPAHLLHPRGGEHFVLRVVGDDMVEEAICDGDYVIVLRRHVAESGEMIIAAVGDDRTVKRYHPEGEMVRLESGARNKPPLLVHRDQCQIEGIVVGVMRKL